jgi:hypothetical protein
LDHPTSTRAHFAPGFSTKDGNPLARTGWHVACNRDSDCFAACPIHPLTGSYYRCMQPGMFTYYDVAITDDSGGVEFVNLTDGTSSSFDVQPGQGVCTDFNYMMFQGCNHPVMAKIVDSLIGCADRFVSQFLCGLELHTRHGDPSTAAIVGNVLYPRTIYDGLTCSDPIDCTQKCRYAAKTSVAGMGTPAACSLCDQQCPSNIVSTITSLVDAVFADMLTAVRLVAVCLGDLGPAGCVCQVRAAPGARPPLAHQVSLSMRVCSLAAGTHITAHLAQV